MRKTHPKRKKREKWRSANYSSGGSGAAKVYTDPIINSTKSTGNQSNSAKSTCNQEIQATGEYQEVIGISPDGGASLEYRTLPSQATGRQKHRGGTQSGNVFIRPKESPRNLPNPEANKHTPECKKKTNPIVTEKPKPAESPTGIQERVLNWKSKEQWGGFNENSTK